MRSLVAGADVSDIVTDIVSELTPRNAWVIELVNVVEEPADHTVVAEPRVNESC
jgi:hypothetical protein